MPRSDHPLSIAAIGVLAYLSADVAHHVIGHPAGCLVMGGRITLIAATIVKCTHTGIVVDLAGPAANLLAGLAALVLASRARQGIMRLFLLLAAAINLFWFDGQIAYSAAAAKDDWNQLILGLGGFPAIRGAFILTGVVAYGTTIYILDRAFAGFARPPGRLPRLLGMAYAATVAAALLTALFDPAGGTAVVRAAAQILLPFGLLMLRSPSTPTTEAFVGSSFMAIGAAFIALAMSILLLGRGIVSPVAM